ncbi:MAG: AMP-binding protein [Candidatus Heteroscillospira sp.]|jgi:fatty-acyl-CoA synthase
MKLSFNTNGWNEFSWVDFYTMAMDLDFSGIEIHNILSEELSGKNRPFSSEQIVGTARKMRELGLDIPCIDLVCDIADGEAADENLRQLEAGIGKAELLGCPCVRVRAGDDDMGAGDSAVIALMERALPMAERAKVSILIETVGIYADTARLRDVLNHFACDDLAALWDYHHTVRFGGESTEQTIQNLGAFVRHIHMKDSVVNPDGGVEYRLMGDGTLPMDELMRALRSVNYDGYMSFEWQPQWMEEIRDAAIVFPHYVNYMGRFESAPVIRKQLQRNVAGTGKFIWEKNKLIRKTFSQVLDAMVEEFPDQYCFKYTTLDYTRTYAEFRDDVDTFARSLIAMGVKAGDKVAVWATNVPQWYIAFWATTKIGGVLVTMNTAYKIHEAEYLLRHSDTHTLIMINGWRDSDYVAAIRELCPELDTAVPGKPLHCKRLPFLRNVINVESRQPGCMTWDEAMAMSAGVPVEEVYRRANQVDIHDVANMQYTSGTTGFPKGVMLTHYNVVNNGKYIGDHMDLSTADRMMIQVPMFHCFGMVLSMTASMTHGTTMCPLPYFSPKPALACINQEHITTFNGVPTMFIAMMQHPDFGKTDFSYMRTGIMAGSNCPADLMRQATEVMNMKQIVSVYGQTEASPGCTMSSFDDPLDVRTDTVGSAFANVECKVVDPETGEECPVGVNGEFVARGYNIMKGYYKMPAATAAAIDADGWLHSGDLAAKDENGNYRITGRLKDMIIRGGENIYPREIEEFFYTHPKVKDVQVIGVPDKQYGEEIMASIVLKAGEESSVEEMKQYVREHMARHKVPRYIDFVKDFPMNAAGKILKYKMREDAAERIASGELK